MNTRGNARAMVAAANAIDCESSLSDEADDEDQEGSSNNEGRKKQSLCRRRRCASLSCIHSMQLGFLENGNGSRRRHSVWKHFEEVIQGGKKRAKCMIDQCG